MDDDFAVLAARTLGEAGNDAIAALRIHQRRCWRVRLLFPCAKCVELERESLLRMREFLQTMSRILRL